MFSYQDIFGDKKKILFVTAHPDDVDVLFGGTVAKLTSDGKQVFVLVVTNGGRGSRENDISEKELGEQRIKEEIEALKILGVSQENFKTLNYLDGEVENNMELVGKIAEIIRKFTPDIVCTMEPNGYYHKLGESGLYFVNHRDHRNTGISALDAVYPFARDRAFFKEHFDQGVNPHTMFEVMFSGEAVTNTKIDIGDVLDKKRQALLSHKSQFNVSWVEDLLKEFKEGDKFLEYGNYIKLAW